MLGPRPVASRDGVTVVYPLLPKCVRGAAAVSQIAADLPQRPRRQPMSPTSTPWGSPYTCGCYFNGFASGSFEATAALAVRGSTLISFGLAATSTGTSPSATAAEILCQKGFHCRVLCIAVARVGAGEIFDGLSIVAHCGDNLVQSRGEMNLGAELDLAVGRAIDGLGTSRLSIEWSLVRIQPGEPRKSKT
jgi:hypothetical protein